MEKIASFTIDHIRLQPGLYVSRKDRVGENVVTTFDLRMTSPNEEPVMNTAEMHTIEHLGATFLRNRDDFGDKTLYFGPMGCRTGFYLLLAGDYAAHEAGFAAAMARLGAPAPALYHLDATRPDAPRARPLRRTCASSRACCAAVAAV